MFAVYKKCTESGHMLFHISIGALVGATIATLFQNVDVLQLVAAGALASLIPDLEHFVFFYSYGRNTDYAKTVRKFIRSLKLRDAATFCAVNHKALHSLYLHNGVSPIVALIAGTLLLKYDNLYWATFSFSIALHYIYDILEDVALNGKVNPNWFLRFDSNGPIIPKHNRRS